MVLWNSSSVCSVCWINCRYWNLKICEVFLCLKYHVPWIGRKITRKLSQGREFEWLTALVKAGFIIANTKWNKRCCSPSLNVVPIVISANGGSVLVRLLSEDLWYSASVVIKGNLMWIELKSDYHLHTSQQQLCNSCSSSRIIHRRILQREK